MTSRAWSRSSRTKASTLSLTIRMTSAAICFRWLCAPPLRINRASSAMSEAWSPIRSRSVTIFSAAVIRRRSAATGCCLSRSLVHRASISRSMSSISPSTANTWASNFSARSSSSSRVLTATAMACWQRLPIMTICRYISSSCCLNFSRIIQTSL